MDNAKRSAAARRERLLVFGIFVLAVAVRAFVSLYFCCSADVGTEMEAGEVILAGGSAWTSKLVVGYFLPALMRLLTRATGIPESLTQTLPAVAGDLLTAYLLLRYARRRGEERAWLLPAIYLFNPATIIWSGFNGNIDPTMAALMLAALELRWRGKLLAAGLVLALAVSLKPPAILALPALVLPLSVLSVVYVALPPMILPVVSIIPFALRDPRAGWFLLSYGAPYGKWGISLILKQSENVARQIAALHSPFIDALSAVNAWLFGHGKYVLLAVLLAWGLYLLLLRSRIATFEAAATATAATFLVFYTFTFGFGANYLAWAAPFLLIASRRVGLWYLAVLSPYLAGVFYQETIKSKYGIMAVTEHLQALTRADMALLVVNGILACIAWGMCIWALWRMINMLRSSRVVDAGR